MDYNSYVDGKQKMKSMTRNKSRRLSMLTVVRVEEL
jgi:hypothetical protein